METDDRLIWKLTRNRFNYTSGSDFHLRSEHTPFFIRPKLKISSKDIDEGLDRRWGELIEYKTTYREDGTAEIPYRTYPLRHFINITVKNEGKDRAINCEVISRLLSKTIDCQWLSEKEQNLCWDDGEIRATIGANGDKAVFHLAFSQENFTPTQKKQISSLFCGIINKDTQVQSWIGTKKALEDPEYRDQDGLCQGEFKVHVEVFTEYGHRIRNDFIIKVGDNWRNLDAEILECGCFRKSRFRRVADFFTHRT